MTSTLDFNKISERFGGIADDYFCSILVLKQTDSSNDSLPFLHAHCLELAAKAVAYKNNLNLSGINGHDILGIYKRIETINPAFTPLIPTNQHLIDYKKVYIRSDAASRNVVLPDPEELDKMELAYFIDNAMNLKYEYTKDFVQLSILKITGPSINQSFLKLYKLSRTEYSTPKLNQRLKKKISELYQGQSDLETRFFEPLGI
jgi:hypothetical protein